jgi:hypothetical protein
LDTSDDPGLPCLRNTCRFYPELGLARDCTRGADPGAAVSGYGPKSPVATGCALNSEEHDDLRHHWLFGFWRGLAPHRTTMEPHHSPMSGRIPREQKTGFEPATLTLAR